MGSNHMVQTSIAARGHPHFANCGKRCPVSMDPVSEMIHTNAHGISCCMSQAVALYQGVVRWWVTIVRCHNYSLVLMHSLYNSWVHSCKPLYHDVLVRPLAVHLIINATLGAIDKKGNGIYPVWSLALHEKLYNLSLNVTSFSKCPEAVSDKSHI